MLDSADDTTPLILAVVLLLFAGALVARALRRGGKDLARLRRARSPKARIGAYRRWLMQSFAIFAGGSAVLVALAWQYVPALADAVAAWPAAIWWRSIESPLVWVGLVVVVVGLLFVPIVFARNEDELATIGDIRAILPRSRRELPWTGALAINAGVFEETMFRLAVPLMLFGITGDAALAFGASVVLFAALHFYQGLSGMLASLVMGAIFTGLVVLTGSLIPAVVLHVLIDVRTLVVIPVVVLEVHKPWAKRRSTARRRERAVAERAAQRDAARAEADAAPESAG